ncbi:MAG: (d)CMP kinase [Magnetovibrionaceae bacterium]
MTVIAIDGPAAAGKGTLAKRLAGHLDFALLDTGLLYRAVGWKVLEAGADPEDEAAALSQAKALTVEDLKSDQLRRDETAQAASKVAVIQSVRAELLAFQRDFATKPPLGAKGAILDGRDIGTVVCPDADAKLFVTASVEVRSARRVKELRDRGEEVIEARVLQDMKDRDERDQSRATAPLKPAEDAHVIDTSDMDADQALKAALAVISQKIA